MFMLAATYQFSLNPEDSNTYSWKSKAVYPGNLDCQQSGNAFNIMCVSSFSFSPSKSFAVLVPAYVNIIDINIGEDSGVFMAYNYTGANWTLQVGIR
jgi:hypothetical protein